MWLLKKVAYQGKRFPHETERGDDKVALYDRKKPYTKLIPSMAFNGKESIFGYGPAGLVETHNP